MSQTNEKNAIRYRRREGSISLETAICLPLCLLILVAFCKIIYAYNAELNLRAATEAAAREAGLALTTAGLWEDLPQTASTYIQSKVDVDLPYVLDEWILELSATELGSAFVLNRIRDFYEADVRYPAIGQKIIIDPMLKISVDDNESVLWLDLDYQINILGRAVSRRLRQAVVLWHPLPTLEEEVSEIPAEIWSMDNFSRGMIFQTLFGRNLVYNYPVFTIFEYGRATAVMSIDLTAPSYSDMNAIKQNIETKLYDIANYADPGEYWRQHKDYFTDSDIAAKVLLLIIPANSPPEQVDTVRNMRYLAQEIGINLIVKRAGDSIKYQDE